MEHILQFGINIDDEKIKKTIVDTASQQIVTTETITISNN